jgi:hypothetical protein
MNRFILWTASAFCAVVSFWCAVAFVIHPMALSLAFGGLFCVAALAIGITASKVKT